MKKRPIRAAFVSLGCSKNKIDCEHMMWLMREAGHEICALDDGYVDAAIVNTCGFIEDAKREAIDEIFAAVRLKEEGRLGCVIVTGCFSGRYGDKLLKSIPEINAVIGPGEFDMIVSVAESCVESEKKVGRAKKICMVGAPTVIWRNEGRLLTTPRHYAYLKIADGCSNRCSYCAIPYIRGPYKSRPMEFIISEAERLAESGVKELLVVAQDVTRYGTNLPEKKPLLCELIGKLAEIPGIRWIRLHYLYPEMLSDEMIETIAATPKVLHYFDIPVQHGDAEILRRMNRRGTPEQYLDLFAKIRAKMPDAVIRTSLITGFPGEKKEHFKNLEQFCKKARFDRAGVFAFSKEEGTPAAKMGRCDKAAALRRKDRLDSLLSSVYSETVAANAVGRELEVLVDEVNDGVCSSRSYADSPEVDGVVLFQSDGSVKPGDFARVRITDVSEYIMNAVLL